VLNYIGAAHAAHSQGRYEARDDYLTKAREVDPQHVLEIDLTHALLQYRAGEHKDAQETLKPLLEKKPRNAKILGLAAKNCEALRDWRGLMDVLPAARRNKALPEEELERLQRLAAVNQLSQVDPARLDNEWKKLPKSEQSDPDLLAAYATRQIQAGNMDETEKMLRKALNREWQPALVRLYGRVMSSDLSAQLKTAEQWASRHPDDADLMLALARICLNHELWGKARSYLEACIGAGGPAEAYHELGRLLEQLEDPDKALAYYRDGLNKAVPGTSTAKQIGHLQPEEQ